MLGKDPINDRLVHWLFFTWLFGEGLSISNRELAGFLPPKYTLLQPLWIPCFWRLANDASARAHYDSPDMRERPHTSYENMNDPCLLDAPATEKAGSDMNPTEKRGAFWSIWRAEKAERMNYVFYIPFLKWYKIQIQLLDALFSRRRDIKMKY